MSTNPEKTKNLIIGHIRGEIAEQYGLPSNIFFGGSFQNLRGTEAFELTMFEAQTQFFRFCRKLEQNLKNLLILIHLHYIAR
jgi:hypothetical protein